MADTAWLKQSKSLAKVQVQGSGLEDAVATVLGWPRGKVVYDAAHAYRVQVDAAFPTVLEPRTVVSVTYTNPDTRGHSNENKLHLKVGELALLKSAHRGLRVALAVGGSGEAWLPYVLKTLQIFYDEVLFLWTSKGRDRLKSIASSPLSVPLGHRALWDNVQKEWATRKLSPEGTVPPKGLLRYRVVDALKSQPIVHHPSLVQNEIARLCLQRSHDLGGAEWDSYVSGRWQNIEMSRNFFNPVEAAVELTLTDERFQFEGGIARDVEIGSLLHDLGMTGTSVSEDFVLHSEALGIPVYIQCKSSGGGRRQHGKNIQNRTKEQITRSVLYRCRTDKKGRIQWLPKRFHWIAVVDGDWGVTQRQPLKYVHMLELAGYDKIICAEALVTATTGVKRKGNPLATYLRDVLRCRKA